MLGSTADGSMFALYAVEIGQGGAVGSVQLNEGGSFFPLLVTPGGDRVLYRDLEDASGSTRLYAVPVDGGSAVPLDLTLPKLESNDLTDGHFILR